MDVSESCACEVLKDLTAKSTGSKNSDESVSISDSQMVRKGSYPQDLGIVNFFKRYGARLKLWICKFRLSEEVWFDGVVTALC